MIFPNDFNSLVNYFSFCMWLFHTATCFTVIIFRHTRPVKQYPRVFKVWQEFGIKSYKIYLWFRFHWYSLLQSVLLGAIWLQFLFFRWDKCCRNPLKLLLRNLIWDMCLRYAGSDSGICCVSVYHECLVWAGHLHHSQIWCNESSK